MADLEHQGRPEPGSSPDGDRGAGDDLATVLSELAQSLQQEPGLEATLQGIVDGAVALVPGAEHASMSAFTKRKEAHTRAASGERPFPGAVKGSADPLERWPQLAARLEE